MKVYILVHDFAIDGVSYVEAEAYATESLAHAAMVKNYNDLKKEYDEDRTEFEEPNDTVASIYVFGRYDETHDEWLIIETELIDK